MRILYDIPMLIFGKLNIKLPFLEKGFNNKIKIFCHFFHQSIKPSFI